MPVHRGIIVAFSWLTVIPIPQRATPAHPDRRVGAAVMAAVPVVGMALGTVAAALAWALSATTAPPLMIAVLVVGALALLTRGMHIDGLADTADGLGCYGTPERVAQVMRSPTVGPFGVATLIMVLLAEVVGVATLTGQGRWWHIALAVTLGRVAAVIATRSTVPAAHPDGFGALVAGTQRLSVIVWPLIALGAGIAIGGLGVGSGVFSAAAATHNAVTVLAVLAVAWLFTRHCARRMGGMTGDVIGAVIEIGTATALVGMVL